MILFAAGLLLGTACNRSPSTSPKNPSAAGPQTRATVITIRTTLQPEARTHDHRIVIAGGKARSSDELDRWRLLDLENGTVTYVDDIARTRRTETIAAVTGEREKLLAAPVPANLPRPTVVATGAVRNLLGVPARQTTVGAGLYQRELWIGEHPAIPPRLYSALVVTDPPSSPLAAVGAPIERALAATRGFPLLDRSELPYGDKKMVVERSVVKIETTNVAQAFLEVPARYRELPSRSEREKAARTKR